MGKKHKCYNNKEDLNPKAFRTKGQKDKSRFLRHIYNSKHWKTLRKEYLQSFPLCECCGAEATQVHHKKRFSSGKSHKEIEKLAYDWNNLMSVCNRCHKNAHSSS